MPSPFNPNGTVPQATAPTLVQIGSSTATTPITINTVIPHTYNDGDYVVVEGHQNNTNANGQWQVHVTGASAFTLIGSVGSAPGAMTGYVSDYSVNPVITLPSGGDARDAASVNTAIEPVADAIPFLNQRVGSYRTFAMTRVVKDDSIGVAFSIGSVTGDGAWHHLTSAQWPYVNGSSIPFNLGLHDILMMDFSGVVAASGGSPTYEAFAFGASFDAGSTWNMITGSPVAFLVATTLPSSPIVISAAFIVSDLIGPGTPTSAVLGLMGRCDSTSTFTVASPYHMTVHHLRHNYLAVQ